ncbi:pyridoxal phosphate-dependent aminotransferase [Anaeromyxobacter paludicola]|uniref:Histidinol-phosphate aminotransferase n=1 Tax=Anaeromyxobacter paludicola TaxID=2918171 RepID=A0ABM7XAR1_9BACT|nr:aminotransferase class I/II-fold pyridoxal phosphate-dependent enzyme [Anaeromyxobacter paludicola]BDG08935.1 histidinol-phosphate aminotransferase [Anaeromyxobacter paludicola]
MSWRDHLREAVFGLELYRPFEYTPGLVRLDANECSFPLEREDRELMAAALGDVLVHRYPEVSGRPLREALASRWGVSPDQIILGNGSDEIISILYTAFGAGRDGRPAKALFPTPTFGTFEAAALARGMACVKVPLDGRFQLDEPALAEAMRREAPALALFATPNNPTGNRFDSAVLGRLAEGFGGVLVADEAYADFSGRTELPRVREGASFCVMKSLSKIGFAALRLGALVGPRDLIAQLDKVRLPYNVNAVSIALARALLASPARLDARIARVRAAREDLAAKLEAVGGLVVYPSDANFVLVRTPVDARGVYERMLAKGVLVRNLSRPGPLENCLRITAGTEEENDQCLEALRAAVQ